MALQEFVKVYTAESNFTGIQGYIIDDGVSMS